MFIVFFVLVFIAVMIIAVVAGVITGIKQAKPTVKNTKTNIYRSKKFNHPTKANDNPLPVAPRFYNIGSLTYHRSRECKGFSLLETWDAITEDQAIQMGMVECPLCKNSIVFIYPRGKVYHRTKFCSDAQSLPVQISEVEAINRGLHRCSKCW